MASESERDRAQIINRPEHSTLTDRTAMALSEAIRRGDYPPGSQLPSENELCEFMAVSRTTLRDAMRKLQDQGLVTRKRGLGTFTSDRTILKDLSKNFGITEMILLAGLEPGTADAKVGIGTAEGEIADRLQLEPGAQVVRVERLRTANGQPVVWSIDVASLSIFGEQDPDLEALESISIYEYVKEALQRRIVRGVASLKPVMPSRLVAELLNIGAKEPILLITQVDYDETDRPLLFSVEYHLADKFDFMIQRIGPSL
jgi:GntR family transcriptional regulator